MLLLEVLQKVLTIISKFCFLPDNIASSKDLWYELQLCFHPPHPTPTLVMIVQYQKSATMCHPISCLGLSPVKSGGRSIVMRCQSTALLLECSQGSQPALKLKILFCRIGKYTVVIKWCKATTKVLKDYHPRWLWTINCDFPMAHSLPYTWASTMTKLALIKNSWWEWQCSTQSCESH